MDYVQPGRAGVKVSPLCLGTMNFGPQADEATGFQIIHRSACEVFFVHLDAKPVGFIQWCPMEETPSGTASSLKQRTLSASTT